MTQYNSDDPDDAEAYERAVDNVCLGIAKAFDRKGVPHEVGAGALCVMLAKYIYARSGCDAELSKTAMLSVFGPIFDHMSEAEGDEV